MTLRAFWLWFKTRGGWVFGGLASLVAMLFFWSRRKNQIEAPIDEVKKTIEEEAEREKSKEAAEGERKENVVHEEASREREAILTDLEKNAEAKDDPDRVKDFLRGVGKDMRED